MNKGDGTMNHELTLLEYVVVYLEEELLFPDRITNRHYRYPQDLNSEKLLQDLVQDASHAYAGGAR